MSDIQLPLGTQIAIHVTWSGGSYAAAIVEHEGIRQEVPMVISLVLLSPAYQGEWSQYVQEHVVPGRVLQATVVGVYEAKEVPGSPLPIVEVDGPHGVSLSVEAVRAGWGIPNPMVWEQESVSRDNFLHAMQIARMSRSGIWGDEAQIGTAIVQLDARVEVATRPRAQFFDHWAWAGIILLLIYVIFTARSYVSAPATAERAAHKVREQERQAALAKRGLFGRTVGTVWQGGMRFVLRPLITIAPKWRWKTAVNKPPVDPPAAQPPTPGSERASP